MVFGVTCTFPPCEAARAAIWACLARKYQAAECEENVAIDCCTTSNAAKTQDSANTGEAAVTTIFLDFRHNGRRFSGLAPSETKGQQAHTLALHTTKCVRVDARDAGNGEQRGRLAVAAAIAAYYLTANFTPFYAWRKSNHVTAVKYKQPLPLPPPPPQQQQQPPPQPPPPPPPQLQLQQQPPSPKQPLQKQQQQQTILLPESLS